MISLPRFGQELRYAELHYAPLGRHLSRFWQPWPDVYFDVPFRVTMGNPAPILLAWADADAYPVRLTDLSILLVSPSGAIEDRQLDVNELRFQEQMGGCILDQLQLNEPGIWKLWIDFTLVGTGVTNSGKHARFRNHATEAFTGEWPLQIRVDEKGLPRLNGLLAGDPHVHSSGTRDMIEFGPDPELLLAAARCVELDWFALTDHSYDLDDSITDYRKNDPELPRWKAQQNWIKNSRAVMDAPLVLPGEELSIEGVGGGILHLLLLGTDRFFHGSADGGESVLRNRSEWKLADLLEEIRDTQILPVSAHTREQPGRGERMLLKRRFWKVPDMRLLQAHQILSGDTGCDFRDGLGKCIDLSLKGHTVAMLGGNDSHGHFSLGRSVRWPGFSLSQGRKQLFGNFRSMVRVNKAGALKPQERQAAILGELASGRTLISNGPLAWFEDESGICSFGGLHLGSARGQVHVAATGCSELLKCRVYVSSNAGEHLLQEIQSSESRFGFPVTIPQAGHLRIELNGESEFATTNLIRLA